jgi:Glycosyl transferase family 2
MKLVQTLVVRDEVDIIDAQIAYHLNVGVDFVIATDHDSEDGTTEILESYERSGHLQLFRERGEVLESDWRTRMARAAATEHEADWVINTDADEFWVPRYGTLKDVLAAVPDVAGVLWATSCHFVPRPDDSAFFAERMTARFAGQAALNDPTSPYRPHAKAVHRSDPSIRVRHGSHRVISESLDALPAWHPADVFHFPFRSLEQYGRKTVRRARGDSQLGQYVKGLQAREQGRLESVYRQLVIDDEALERGLAAGSLVRDTRLRDALRKLRIEDGRFSLPAADAAPLLSKPDDEARSRFALDEAALRDSDVVRLVRRLDELSTRVDAIASRPWARVGKRRGRT